VWSGRTADCSEEPEEVPTSAEPPTLHAALTSTLLLFTCGNYRRNPYVRTYPASQKQSTKLHAWPAPLVFDNSLQRPATSSSGCLRS
jgi:hypothetical protein